MESIILRDENLMELPKIKDALSAYHDGLYPGIRLPQLVEHTRFLFRNKEGLHEFVKDILDNEQIEGARPLLYVKTFPEGLTPVTLRLWWNKKLHSLEEDYLD